MGFIHAFQLVLSLATSVIMARALGAQDFGALSFVLSLVALLALLSYVGLPPLLTRQVAIYEQTGAWGSIKGLTQWSYRLVLMISIPIAAMATIVGAFNAEWSPGDRWTLLAVTAVAIPMLGIFNVWDALFRGLRKVAVGSIPNQVVRPTLYLLMVLALWWIGALNGTSAAVSNVLALTGAFALHSFLLKRVRPSNYDEIEPATTSTAWFRSLLPFSAIGLVGYLNTEMIIPLVGILTVDEQVAFFRVALSLALLVALPLTLVESVIHPHVSRLFQSGDQRQLNKLVFVAGAAAFLLSVPIVIVFATIGEPLINLLYGGAYTEAHIPLIVLAVGFGLTNLVGPSMLLLHATAFENDAFIISLLSVALTLILSLLLIPTYGALGATITFSGGKVFRAVCFRLWAGYRLKTEFSKKI